jgi:hypothetical protein
MSSHFSNLSHEVDFEEVLMAFEQLAQLPDKGKYYIISKEWIDEWRRTGGRNGRID